MPARAALCFLASALLACGLAQPEAVPAARITPSPPATTPAGGRPATASPRGVTTPPGAPTPAPSPPAETHPFGSVYEGQLHGYDASYPQCGASRAPGAARLSVIGVNAGKAFTANPCLARQWRSGAPPKALYVNSGFNPDNYSKTTQDCIDLAARLVAGEGERRAYAIGCGEAVHSLGAARNAGAGDPLMWWIDVESSNSWDEVDLNLNRFSLQGELEQLAAGGKPVGVYSTFKDWYLVTGGWRTNAIAAAWLAGQSPADACAAPGFSGAAVWLAQERATWADGTGYDSDWSC